MNKKAVLEGLLFVVGDEGITMDEIMSILEIDSNTAKELVLSMKIGDLELIIWVIH